MSVHVLSWVLRNSEEKLGRRLVLIVLADYANEDGSLAYPSVATIARDTRLSERQVQYCLRGLEEAGAIKQAGKRSNGTVTYQVVMGGANIAPGGAVDCTGGVQSTTGGGAVGCTRSTQDPPLTHQEEVHTGAALEPAAPKGIASPVNADSPDNRPTKVSGKKVTDTEYGHAVAVLAQFNINAGTRYFAKTYIEMIIRRMREHPEVTDEQHTFVIQKTLANPWWDGPPSPNVIYGNAGIFEKSVHAAVMPGGGKGVLTREEIRALGDRR